jgi:4-amino-4-deoxy-L-arabinose transferase-like glycosyltransferase
LSLESRENFRRGLIFLFLPIAVFYFYGLGAIPLVGPDEPRYAEVAREMLARRDLITPTLGGHVWFEKPALLYWLMMAGYRLLGVSEYAARLGDAVCGLLTGAIVFWIGSRVSLAEAQGEESRRNDLAWLSALAFLSSAGAIVFSRAASFDIVVTMSIAGALACFFLWEIAPDRNQGSRLAGFYFFVGVSLLAKGLIGIVIPLAVVASYFLFRRKWPNRSVLLSLAWGVPLAAVVALIWYGPMIARHGWKFIDQFFVQHHFARFVSNKYHHPQPFYFYVPILALLALPWTGFLGTALVGARSWNWRSDSPRDRLRVFAFAWTVAPIVFFSLSRSKLAGYILPVLPGVALLVGDELLRFLRRQTSLLAMRLTGALAIVVAAVGAVYAVRTPGVMLSCVVIAGVPIVIVALLAVLRPQIGKALLVLLALVTLGAFAVALKCGAREIARGDSVRDLIEAGDARGYGALRIVQLFSSERTAEFYAAGRLPYRDDGEPLVLEGITQIADAARQSGGSVLVLAPTAQAWKLSQARNLSVEIIGDNGRVVLALVRAAH